MTVRLSASPLLGGTLCGLALAIVLRAALAPPTAPPPTDRCADTLASYQVPQPRAECVAAAGQVETTCIDGTLVVRLPEKFILILGHPACRQRI